LVEKLLTAGIMALALLLLILSLWLNPWPFTTVESGSFGLIGQSLNKEGLATVILTVVFYGFSVLGKWLQLLEPLGDNSLTPQGRKAVLSEIRGSGLDLILVASALVASCLIPFLIGTGGTFILKAPVIGTIVGLELLIYFILSRMLSLARKQYKRDSRLAWSLPAIQTIHLPNLLGLSSFILSFSIFMAG